MPIGRKDRRPVKWRMLLPSQACAASVDELIKETIMSSCVGAGSQPIALGCL